MGEPVRIAEIARRLAAASTQRVEIVFSGLRPGEKLMEDLLGHGEADHRPCHPLISQVPVPPLPPTLLAGLDPAAGADTLRAALARCAAAPGLGEHDDLAAPDQAAGRLAAGRPRVLSLVSPVPGAGAMAAHGDGAESALLSYLPPSRALRMVVPEARKWAEREAGALPAWPQHSQARWSISWSSSAAA
jgi:hypothetical protein